MGNVNRVAIYVALSIGEAQHLSRSLLHILKGHAVFVSKQPVPLNVEIALGCNL